MVWKVGKKEKKKNRERKKEDGKAYDDNHGDSCRRGKSKLFETDKMQNDESRPEKGDVEDPDQTEEDRHVDARFIVYLLLQDDRVDAVHDGAEAGHGVSQGDLSRTLRREFAVIAIACGGGRRSR